MASAVRFVIGAGIGIVAMKLLFVGHMFGHHACGGHGFGGGGVGGSAFSGGGVFGGADPGAHVLSQMSPPGAQGFGMPVLFIISLALVLLLMLMRTASMHRRHSLDTDQRLCRGCGTSHPSFAAFCRRCGRKLS